MAKKPVLPEGFRIANHQLRAGDAGDPYDHGDWTYRLDIFETRTVGHWFWRRQVTRWWPVEYNSRDSVLIQTALLLKGSR